MARPRVSRKASLPGLRPVAPATRRWKASSRRSEGPSLLGQAPGRGHPGRAFSCVEQVARSYAPGVRIGDDSVGGRRTKRPFGGRMMLATERWRIRSHGAAVGEVLDVANAPRVRISKLAARPAAA